MPVTLLCIDPGVELRLYGQELDLRFRVLREPLGMAREQTPFPGEVACLHVLARDGEAVVGDLSAVVQPGAPDGRVA